MPSRFNKIKLIILVSLKLPKFLCQLSLQPTNSLAKKAKFVRSLLVIVKYGQVAGPDFCFIVQRSQVCNLRAAEKQ